MAPSTGITVVLGEDLLREVLVRLPKADDLVHAAAACKPFLLAARNPPFLRRFRRLHPSTCPRLLGCLALPAGFHNAAPQLLTSSDDTSDSSDSPTGDLAHSSSSSSSTGDLAHAYASAFSHSYLPGGSWLGDSNKWLALDCRNGRILLMNLESQELGVSDPLSRRHIVLPAPPAQRAVGWGLVADDGDSSAFQVVCIARDAGPHDLRALVLSSGERCWADVASISCPPDPARFQAMQANQSLYWKLEGEERMVAFTTATMEFSLLDLPPSFRELSFDVIERGVEDRGVLHLLTISGGFCIEVWAGTADGNGGMAWTLVDRSVRFHKQVKEMFRPSSLVMQLQSQQNKVDVVGVAANVVFLQQWEYLFSIDLETMKLRVLSDKGCPPVRIYPYTIAWPPSFLNPGGQGM